MALQKTLVSCSWWWEYIFLVHWECSPQAHVLSALLTPACGTVLKAVKPLGGRAWVAEVGRSGWAFKDETHRR